MSLPHNQKIAEEKGLTLIEVSVILSVLAIMSAFLVPSVSHFLQEANLLQARHDVDVIASGLINFMNDTGQSPATLGAYLADSKGGGLLDVLAGPGRIPGVNQGNLASKPRARLIASVRQLQPLSSGSIVAWREGRVAPMEDFLLTNACGLPLKRAGIGMGWNGPYFNSQLGSDPWGNQYLVNVGYLDTQAGAGDAEGGVRKAVFVISAGPNQIIETPFSQPVSDAFVYGDDIVARVR